MRRRSSVRVTTLVVAAFALTACGSGSGSSTTQASGDGVTQEFALGERVQLRAFSGETLAGAAFDSSDALGHVLVINVWGSWCVPCRGEAPDLKRASEDLAESGVRFVGVDVRDNDTAALTFERTYGITYPSINTDTSAAAVLALSAAAPSNAVPSTIILDRQGRVAARVVGPSTYATLMALIEPVTAEAPDPSS